MGCRSQMLRQREMLMRLCAVQGHRPVLPMLILVESLSLKRRFLPFVGELIRVKIAIMSALPDERMMVSVFDDPSVFDYQNPTVAALLSLEPRDT